jgi:hypothetical protein
MYTSYAIMYVLHTYRPSFAVVFLILAGSAAVRFSTWMALLVVAGYIAFDFLDCVLKRKAVEKLLEDETTGWKQDKEGSEWESRGNLSRIKLTGSDQIIVGRIGEMLRRMPR